jgi:hypothetical protein
MLQYYDETIKFHLELSIKEKVFILLLKRKVHKKFLFLFVKCTIIFLQCNNNTREQCVIVLLIFTYLLYFISLLVIFRAFMDLAIFLEQQLEYDCNQRVCYRLF